MTPVASITLKTQAKALEWLNHEGFTTRPDSNPPWWDELGYCAEITSFSEDEEVTITIYDPKKAA
jgi:hypothetical protein